MALAIAKPNPVEPEFSAPRNLLKIFLQLPEFYSGDMVFIEAIMDSKEIVWNCRLKRF